MIHGTRKKGMILSDASDTKHAHRHDDQEQGEVMYECLDMGEE